MNTNNVRMNKNIVVVNRNNKALIYNAVSGKFQVVEDNNTSMASIKAIMSIVENLSENANYTTTIVIPRSMSLLLRPQQIDELIANNYTTEDGEKQYTKEYLDSLKYISDMKKYLGTAVCQYRIQAYGTNSILTKEQNQAVRNAWALMDSLEKPQVVHKQRPQRPANIVMQSVEVDIL